MTAVETELSKEEVVRRMRVSEPDQYHGMVKMHLR